MNPGCSAVRFVDGAVDENSFIDEGKGGSSFLASGDWQTDMVR
jgi:hypothetical protein